MSSLTTTQRLPLPAKPFEHVVYSGIGVHPRCSPDQSARRTRPKAMQAELRVVAVLITSCKSNIIKCVGKTSAALATC